ncbi:hypothetical protein JT359_07730 [Candidatus Poribacteria bacterium]|nr:hypothetical protein [Candidatus Poribacteria bacterium]
MCKTCVNFSMYIALLWSASFFNTFFLQTYHASGMRMCNLRGRINTDDKASKRASVKSVSLLQRSAMCK